ncbi:MAG: type IX secretion system outer membrane channel protein PorV [Prevotella sp.]|nr:type IX secretion system outer membrane channel protein PorV [Prevotella sp.]
MTRHFAISTYRQFAIALAIVVTFAVTGRVSAADSKTSMFNPIHTAMVSNNIAPDARAGGMGDVGAATDPDVASQYWNPAKYPFCISRAGVQLSYTPWLRQLVNDMNIAYMSGYYRIGDYSAISASLHYFSLGEVYFADESGNADLSQSIKPYEMSVDAAYSLMLSEKFSLAAGVRFLLSDISYSRTEESSAATAFAADLACYYQNYVNIGQRECQLGLGLSLRNMGSKMTFAGSNRSEFLPTNLRLGASLMIPINEYNRFTIAADANKLLVPTYPTIDQDQEAYAKGETSVGDGTDNSSNLEAYADEVYYSKGSIAGMFSSFTDAPGGFKEELEEIQWSIGAEYVYNDRFSLRAGYHDEAQSKGNRKYFTVGAGFRMSAFTLDAAYVISTAQSNPLDQTLRFSLNFDLDGIKDLFGRR